MVSVVVVPLCQKEVCSLASALVPLAPVPDGYGAASSACGW